MGKWYVIGRSIEIRNYRLGLNTERKGQVRDGLSFLKILGDTDRMTELKANDCHRYIPSDATELYICLGNMSCLVGSAFCKYSVQ